MADEICVKSISGIYFYEVQKSEDYLMNFCGCVSFLYPGLSMLGIGLFFKPRSFF